MEVFHSNFYFASSLTSYFDSISFPFLYSEVYESVSYLIFLARSHLNIPYQFFPIT